MRKDLDTPLIDSEAKLIGEVLGGYRGAIVELLTELAKLESPSLEPDTQRSVQDLLQRLLEGLGFESHFFKGDATGGHLHF